MGLPSKCNDWWFGVQNVSAKDEERRKAAKYIAHAINTHDDLVKKVSELELSLDDRDCYIADADMKNEEASKRVAELKKALVEVSEKTIDLFSYTIDEKNYYSGHIYDCLVNDEVGTIRSMVKEALKESE